MDTVGHPGDVVKSAFALVVGLLMILTSAAGYAYVRLTMSDQTPEAPADSGLAACQALAALPERDSLDDLTDDIITGLAGSENTELHTAGSTLEALAALPPEQHPAAAPQVSAALSQVALGCAALGVSLPAPASDTPAEG